MAIVVVGLAISTPPASIDLSGDHVGALVHPIFPHAHSDGHGFSAADPLTNLASHEPANHDVAPGLSVPLSQAGGREAAAGVVLPLLLTTLTIGLSRRRYQHQPVLAGRSVSPPTPPPRLLASMI